MGQRARQLLRDAAGPVLETLKAGQDVLFDIDVQGAAQLHLSLPRGQYVFLLPPSLSELERRLRGRGTDDEASIAAACPTPPPKSARPTGSMHGSSTTIWTRPMTSCARSTLPRRSTPHTARGWQTPFWKDELMAQLIVALDYTNAEDALATAESLRGCPIWMKVGLELFTHEGPAVAKKLKDMTSRSCSTSRCSTSRTRSRAACVRPASWASTSSPSTRSAGNA